MGENRDGLAGGGKAIMKGARSMILDSDIEEIMRALDYEFKDAINIDEDWSELRDTIENVLKHVHYMQAQRKEQDHEYID